MNLAHRFVLGSVYLGAGHVAGNAANLVMQLVIARLLGPTVFGVYAFCFAINQFIEIVGAFSLSFALIQSREESQSQYDTAFAICGGLGLIGLLIAAAIAPLLWLERSAEAAWVLMVLALVRVLSLLAQIPVARLERALRYGTVTLVTIVVSVSPNVVAVGLAWLGWGVWSLAVRDVLVGLLLLVLMWLASGYRFRGRVERQSWRQLMSFSRPMFVSRSIEILMERLDSLAVGVFLGNRAVGLYHQARFLSEAGYAATRPVERLSFNVYARVQDDPARLARSWALVNYFLLRTMLAGSAVLLVFPEETIRLLLGEEWLEVAPLLRWLALFAGLLPLLHNAKNLCYGLGQVQRMVRVRLIQAVIFVGAVTAATLAGSLTAMAAGLLFTTLVALGLAWRQSLDLVASPPLARLAAPLILLALTAGGFAWLLHAGVLEGVPWFVRPFLPPVVFFLGVFATEPVTLLREVAYLVGQLRQREESG